ncbi:hypothetical protein QJS66_01290 [Kocuria rhizophila]|nr:hypothetical protein QJS66_01290 [Kocuria rhizophila]
MFATRLPAGRRRAARREAADRRVLVQPLHQAGGGPAGRLPQALTGPYATREEGAARALERAAENAKRWDDEDAAFQGDYEPEGAGGVVTRGRCAPPRGTAPERTSAT